MASVRRNGKPGASDDECTWSVLFRQNKKQRSKTFVSKGAAEDFRDLVERFGPERALKYLEDETPAQAGMSLDELAEKWLASKKGNVTPNILHGYRRDYDNWIRDRLGHREAAAIDERDVQEWVDWMRVRPAKKGGEPIGAKSIADRHAILHQIFKWGSSKTRGLVDHNPCKETELPKRTKRPPKGLRLTEFMALIEAGEHADRDTSDLVAFIAGTGWRIGEAIALTAGSVEDDGDRVYVSMDHVHRRLVGFTEGGKSEAAEGRRLRVVGPGIDVLRRRVVGKRPGDFVFTFKDGRPGVDREGPWNPASFRDRRWKELVRAAGLADRKPTPHWLRHTHVALCHAAGFSLAEIQRRIGHEDIQTTINVYGKMIDEMSDESAVRLDRLLTPRPAREQVIEGVVVGELTD